MVDIAVVNGVYNSWGGHHIVYFLNLTVFVPTFSSLRCQVHSLRDGRKFRRPRPGTYWGDQVGWKMAGILTEPADS